MNNLADTRARIVAILQEIGARDVLDIGGGHGALAKNVVNGPDGQQLVQPLKIWRLRTRAE